MRIDFDRIVPKYRDCDWSHIANIVADSTHVQFFLEECERYGIMWTDGEFPTDYNPLDHYPGDVFFRFGLYDERNDERGVVELTFSSYAAQQVLRPDDILITDLIVEDDEIGISSDPPIPLDLSSLFAEVSS